MSFPPHAPWELAGECVVGVVWRRRARADLPAGVDRLPGPVLVIAVAYAESPVGPYLELAVAEPARVGLRTGLCVTTMVVNRAASRVAGICNWGFPKELGTLRWSRDDDAWALSWEEGDLTVTAAARTGRSVPASVPLRAVQRRSDGPVIVPARLRGRAQSAVVTVAAGPGVPDRLAPLAGRHRGVLVRGMRLVVEPARHPGGVTAPLRAPFGAPEAAAVPATPPGAGS